VRETIHVSLAEDKTSAELEGVLAELVLVMTRRTGPLPAGGINFAQKVEQIRRSKPRNSIGLAMVVNQERELDPSLLPKHSRVVGVTQPDGGQRSSFVPEGLLVFAQLRDMFAAENSSVMAEKDEHRGAAGPHRPEPDLLAIRIGKHDFGESATERLVHDGSILRSVLRVVKSNCPNSNLARPPIVQ
jgi:hypothetical protein